MSLLLAPDAVSTKGALGDSRPQPEARRPSLGRCGQRVLGLLTSAVVGMAVLAFGFLAVGPHLLGYRTMTMLTGSMTPTIRPGDVVVDTPEPSHDLRVGQIVTYRIPVLDRHVESHRVTSVVDHPDGSVSFTTKGDANPAADPWAATVAPRATMWRVRGVIPLAGTAIRVLRQPLVGTALRWGGLASVVTALLAVIWRRSEPSDSAGAPEPSMTGEHLVLP